MLQVGLWNRIGGKHTQSLCNRLREIGALRATLQMPGNRAFVRAFMKLISDQFFFREVFHRRPPAIGVSERRSLLTARKTACLAELLVMFSAAAISAMGTSSICRRVNAVLSIGVSSAIAAWRRLTASRFSRLTSGPACLSAIWTVWSAIDGSSVILGAWYERSRPRRSTRLIAVFIVIRIIQVEKAESCRKLGSLL